jgi:hypothetical protein
MAKIRKSYILVVVSYLHLHIIFTYYPSYMSLKYRKIVYLSINSLVTIKFSLNFIQILCVKDLQTRQLLLQRPSKLGLYPWLSSHAPSNSNDALIGEKVYLDQWHLRLGHLASPIVSRVIQSNKLPMVSSKLSTICSPCQQGKSHRLHFSISPSISSAPLQLLFLDV